MISRLTIPINTDYSVEDIEKNRPGIIFYSWETVSELLKKDVKYKQPGHSVEVRGIRCIDQGIELIIE